MKLIGKDDKLLVIIGPSGSGKTDVVSKLIKDNIITLTPSVTTRLRREDEENAQDHVFLTSNEFELREKDNQFLETVVLFNSNYRYGLPKIYAGKDGTIPTIMLRSMVMPLLGKYYSNVIIYHIESEKITTKERISKRRNDTTNDSRLASYDEEVCFGRKYSDRVFENNGSFKSLYSRVLISINEDFRKT